MPSEAVQNTPRTSPHIQKKRNDFITTINSDWDLDIPYPDELVEERSDLGTPTELAKQCTNGIVKLAWRDGYLGAVLKSFESKAHELLPGWEWKRRQASGTIPNQPRTLDQLQQRDYQRQRKTARKYKEPLRRILKEEIASAIKQIPQDDQLKRRLKTDTSTSTTTNCVSSRQHPPKRPLTPDESPEGERTDPPRTPNKQMRPMDIPEVGLSFDPKRRCQTRKITDSFSPQEHVATDHPGVEVGDSAGVSFGSTSTEPLRVFSQSQQLSKSSSAATSFQDNNASSQDLFSTQADHEILRDPAIRRSLQIIDGGSSSQASRAPSQLSLAPTAETSQMSEASEVVQPVLGSGLTNQVTKLIDMLENASPFEQISFKTVDEWRAGYKDIVVGENTSQMVMQSVSLEWTLDGQARKKRLFDLKVNELHLDKSCRFQRQYGSDRFMTVYLPAITPQNLPSHLKPHYSDVLEAMASWLSGRHNFLGRSWKVYFLGPEKRTRRKPRTPRFKVCLFAERDLKGKNAESRPSIRKIPLRKFLDWHIPVLANIESKDCKMFQRFSLGLSKTTPTVVLRREEFIRITGEEPVMNDGCARMSRSLANEVWKILDGSGPVPSVFQGRIGGAKGVWMVDENSRFAGTSNRNYYIEVSDNSQLKVWPHPADIENADESQRTFEVSEWSKRPRPAALNCQLITVLHDRKVPRDAFVKLFEDQLGRVHEDLTVAKHDPILLRSWINTVRGSTRERRLDCVGSWPADYAEQAIYMLEHGFHLRTTPLLVDRIRGLLKDHLSRFIEGLPISVPLSTNLYCIADPYGVLAEDEVHCGFSSCWDDERAEFNGLMLDGFNVLVARSPALLPSDVQRRKARWKLELCHFKDVIVFPSTGTTPLASMLAGGDYDGDTVWVCWEPSLVQPFEKAELPVNRPSHKDCGIVDVNTPLKDIFKTHDGRRVKKGEADRFFRNCIAFNLKPNLQGHCTLEFEKVAYHEGTISSEAGIKLATLASYLVDAAKAGSYLADEEWRRRILPQVSPNHRPIPAFRELDDKKRWKESNVLDYLIFGIAFPTVDKFLREYHEQWEHVLSDVKAKDEDLTRPWADTSERSMNEFREKNRGLSDILKVLDAQLDEVKHLLKGLQNEMQRFAVKPLAGVKREDYLRDKVEQIRAKYAAIEPPKVDHPVYIRFVEEKTEGYEFNHWALLKASGLYNRYSTGSLIWYLAGAQLCEIKYRAHSSPRRRTMLLDFYNHYKFDKRSVVRLRQTRERLARRADRGPEQLDDHQDDSDSEDYTWRDSEIDALLEGERAVLEGVRPALSRYQV